MALTRQDPLRYFVGFGSISGRFGGNGLSDYAAANDLLAKLVDWFRKERPECASACLEWESWGEVGQAVRPQNSVGAKNVLNLEFMPLGEGIEHLEEEMRAGLPEPEVLFSDGKFYRTFYPDDSTLAAPELAGLQTPGATGVSPVRGEHGQDARATRIVVGLRDVEIVNGLVFRSDEPVTVRLSAMPDGNEVRCELSCDFQDRKGRVVQRERPYFRGVVELASQPARIDALPTGEPPEKWYPNVYLEDREVYHGPVLRSLKEYAHDSDGCWGKIVAPPVGMGAAAE